MGRDGAGPFRRFHLPKVLLFGSSALGPKTPTKSERD